MREKMRGFRMHDRGLERPLVVGAREKEMGL
jgi:hypothetical protein